MIHSNLNTIIKRLKHGATAFSLVSLCGCGPSLPDTVEDTVHQPPLELPPINIKIANESPEILQEELYGRWKITSLDEWGAGDYVMFTDDFTMFSFKCNIMNVSGELTHDGKWHVPNERYGTTEAGCASQTKQNEALLSLMIGPSKIQWVGTDKNTLHIASAKHDMKLELDFNFKIETRLSHADLIGQWDITRFDNFVPTSRLNGEGKRSAYIDFGENKLSAGALDTALHVGCNYSGNNLHLNQKGETYALTHIATAFGEVRTEKGCPKNLQHRDDDFFSMMNKSPKVERIGLHSLRLSTKEHELILEKSAIGKTRNAIRNYEAITGKWDISMAYKDGFGLGAPFHTPEPIVISKERLQYGDISPYIKAPKIDMDGKIKGEMIGDFGDTKCDENEFLLEDTPKFIDTAALCFVINTITREPIADPLNSPDFIQLSTEDYRLVLKRSKQ